MRINESLLTLRVDNDATANLARLTGPTDLEGRPATPDTDAAAIHIFEACSRVWPQLIREYPPGWRRQLVAWLSSGRVSSTVKVLHEIACRIDDRDAISALSR